MKLYVKVILVGAVIWGVIAMRSPYRTVLPENTTDLTSIQKQLNRLSTEDRALVLDYIELSRNNGLGDHSNVHTFADVIDYQHKRLKAQMADKAQGLILQDEREKELAPLRAAVKVKLVRKELIERSQFTRENNTYTSDGREIAYPIDEREVPVGERKVLVTTFLLINNSREPIKSIEGTIVVRRTDSPSNIGKLCICTFYHELAQGQPLVPGDSIETKCETRKGSYASAQDRNFAGMSNSDLALEWTPRIITFANGERLIAR